ncbi:MAG: efflux RND transporter periplasmic adaptor subunit [Prevotellaceae bacterium]|jgi:RND family efflux transporter MFP subunit|nr:efflux RND transporter periplasmic adaptor subunit [Prevotellaceae bacterium]
MKAVRNIAVCLSLVALVVTTTSCGGGSTRKANAASVAANSVKKVQVKVAVAELQNVEQIAEFSGTVTANVRNSIASAGATRIDKILVEVGDRVAKGQTLVEMEPSNYLQASAQLQNLKVEYSRAEALYQSGGVSKQQLDQLKTQLDVAETSTQNLAINTHLVSPVGGVVTARNFDNGDVAGGAPILVVEQLNPLKIQINVSEEYFSRVKVGMRVNIALEVYPDKHFQGNVSLIYPTVDATTRTFTVEVAIPNDQMLIRPGMFARATLNLGTMPHTVIPDIAVQKQQGTNDRFVFVIHNGVAIRKVVQLGRRLDDKMEILKEVAPGEHVAIAGVTRLVDQTEVEVVE